MWLFLSTRLRRWLFVTAVVPLVAVVARTAADQVERRRGPGTLSHGMRRVGGIDLRSRRRGR